MATAKLLSMLFLLAATLGSAMAVIYCKYYSRLIFIEMQKQEKS